MSLNRAEQLLFDYVQRHPEERQHWIDKVRAIAGRPADGPAAAAIAAELWRYYEERSRVAAPFREIARREGMKRTSMLNLAEYLLRQWTEPRTKRPAPTEDTKTI